MDYTTLEHELDNEYQHLRHNKWNFSEEAKIRILVTTAHQLKNPVDRYWLVDFFVDRNFDRAKVLRFV